MGNLSRINKICPKNDVFLVPLIQRRRAMMLITYVMFCLDTLKLLKWTILYKQCFKYVRNAFDLLIHCFQAYIFKVVQLIVWTYYWKIGKGGGGDMGETNCEKGKNYCFFHTTTPYTICNLLSLWDQPNAWKPHWNTISFSFLQNGCWQWDQLLNKLSFTLNGWFLSTPVTPINKSPSPRQNMFKPT